MNEKKHAEFIRSLPCCFCKAPPKSEWCHIRLGSNCGMARRPHHRRTVPLCAGCHRTGPNAQHKIGELKFWADINAAIDLAENLYINSGNHEKALELIVRWKSDS